MSDYNKMLKEREELSRLKVDLVDKSLGKFFDQKESFQENKTEDQIKKEANFIVEEKMKNRKIKLKRFKKFILGISLTTVGVGAYINYKIVYTPEVKAAINLQYEIEMHGGSYSDSAGYKWDLKSHLESGGCRIPNDNELSMEERIYKYCDENNLTKEEAQAAYREFQDYYTNGTAKAVIVDMVKERQKAERKGKKNTSSINDLSKLKTMIEQIREQNDNQNSLGR